MKIISPFQVHSWKIRPLIVFVSAVQVSLLGSIALDLLGLQIPLVRQFIGIIYLLFIPGILILRVLKLDKLGNIESLLYTVGLSIAFLMFTGFFINQLYPLIGILNPISIIPLIVTISCIVVILLFIICYYKDKSYYSYTYIAAEKLFSPKSLFLFLIPFLAVFGTYLVNNYHNNNLIVIFIISIFLIILSYGFLNFIPTNLYPLAIFIISISLLFHNSLISIYVWGCDIQQEYYLANLVMNGSYWNSGIEQNTNAMLSIVMLVPIISNICNIDLVWIFKIIFPLLFSLLPLGLYKIFDRQTSDEIAFLSCLFFISCFPFYTEMLALARQQISELFFVLLILLMINPFIENSKKAILSIVFSFSIIVSHYAFSYIFIISLLFTLILFISLKKIDGIYVNVLNVESNTKQVSFEKLISSNFIILFVIFALSWYLYISRGSAFSVVVRIGDSILNSLFTDFLNPEKAQGLEILTSQTKSQMRDITKYLHMISIFFISIGLLKSILNRKSIPSNNAYVAFSVSYFMICVLGIAVPLFAIQLNTSRLYYISLLILAPFFSIGGISFFNIVTHHKLNAFWENASTKRTLKLLSIFLAVFFLFNSGLIYEIKNEDSSSVSLNNTHYPFIYDEEEILAANWINLNKNQVTTIYADEGGANLLRSITSDSKIFFVLKESISFPENQNNYIFITKLNTNYNQIYIRNSLNQLEYIDLKYLSGSNKINNIYDSGYGKIEFV